MPEYLTAEQALAEMDEYCTKIGRMNIAIAIRSYYEKTGKLVHAVLHDLKLEPVKMYRRKD
jgi:hypothetical protein